MTRQRFKELWENPEADLTLDEIRAGYHFCAEWDGLCVGPMDPEFDCCTCFTLEQRKHLEEHGELKLSEVIDP